MFEEIDVSGRTFQSHQQEDHLALHITIIAARSRLCIPIQDVADPTARIRPTLGGSQAGCGSVRGSRHAMPLRSIWFDGTMVGDGSLHHWHMQRRAHVRVHASVLEFVDRLGSAQHG